MDDRKMNKVRKRRSYEMWAKLLIQFRRCENDQDRIKAVRALMDSENMFGTNQKAIYSMESMEQVFRDFDMGILREVLEDEHDWKGYHGQI